MINIQAFYPGLPMAIGGFNLNNSPMRQQTLARLRMPVPRLLDSVPVARPGMRIGRDGRQYRDVRDGAPQVRPVTTGTRSATTSGAVPSSLSVFEAKQELARMNARTAALEPMTVAQAKVQLARMQRRTRVNDCKKILANIGLPVVRR